jgi:hypothetical protein
MAEDVMQQETEQVEQNQQTLPTQEEPPKKLSVQDFASKIKSKYPEYKNIEDNELVNKIIAKYPVYKEQIEFSQKKNDGQPLKPGGQEKPTGVSPTPSKSPAQSPWESEKGKTKEQIAKEDFESAYPIFTQKIDINKPGDIMTGQQKQQMAASKVISDKKQDYQNNVISKKAAEEKQKAKAPKPQIDNQFNPVDFAINDVVNYGGGSSLAPNLDPNAPQPDKFHQLNTFFGNDATNATSYFEHRIKDVDNQIKQIRQNPMLWRNLNQGKSDLKEIAQLEDYKLKLGAASNKLATDYTAWLYPEASTQEKGFIKRKLAGDKSVYDEIAFKEKGIPLTDEQKFNNAKQGLDVERTRLENDYREIPPEQRDDIYFQRLAQLNDNDAKLINQFPDYKRNQVGMVIAQLASQDKNIDTSNRLGFVQPELEQSTVDYISNKYKIPKEDLKGITYGDIPKESLWGNIEKGLYGLGASLLTGSTRLIGSMAGVDSDRLTYINKKISESGDKIFGDNPYESTSHPQSIIDINSESPTYLQNIPNPKAGKANYNLTSASHAMADGAAGFAAFIGGLGLATKGVQALEWASMIPLTEAAEQSAAMASYMIISNYENNWQKGNQVLGKDASEAGKAVYATLSGYIDKLAFDVLPKDKLFLTNEAKSVMDKELSPYLKNLTIKDINKEVLQTKVQKVVEGIVNTAKEVGHITSATSAAEISKGIINSIVGEGKPKQYMEESWQGVKHNLIETPLAMGLPLGVMEMVKMKQNSSFFKENVYNAGLEPNKYIALIKQELGKNNLTQEEANSRIEVVKTMHNIVQSTPDINPKTGEKLTHSQQVEYAYNRLKESALRAKALEAVDDPAIASIYLTDAQDLVDVRKAMLESFAKQPKKEEAAVPEQKTIAQQKVDIERQRQDELDKSPENADIINAKYDKEIAKLSEQEELPLEKPIEELIPKEQLDKTQSVIDRVNNNENINEGELKEAEDILYTALESNPKSAHLIEPLIEKLQTHENITNTETVKTTEREPIEGTLAAKRKIEIKPALEQSEGSTATVTLADGTTGEGTLRIKDGNYVLEVEGENPIVIGEKAITDRDLKTPEGESPVELDENGNVKSATFETKDGHKVTITDPEKALDLGIQLSLETVGEIPDEAFDKVYQDVVKETQVEVPIEKPKVEKKAEAEVPEQKEEKLSPEEADIEKRRQNELSNFDENITNKGRLISDAGEVETFMNADGEWSVSTSLPKDKNKPWERTKSEALSGEFKTKEEALEFAKSVIDKLKEKTNAKYDAEKKALKEKQKSETGAEPQVSEQKEQKDRQDTQSKLKNLSDEKFDETKKKAGYGAREAVTDETLANEYHDALKVPEPERTEKQNKIIAAVNEALGTKKRGKVAKKAKGKAAMFVAEHIEEPTAEGEGEAEPEKGEPVGAIPTQTHTVETVDQIDTTGFNEVQKKNINDVKRVLKAITKLVGKNILKDLKVVVHSTRESAAKAAYDSTIKSGGSESDAKANMYNQGNRGWWASATGEIHLNIPEVTSETALHEGIHPILDILSIHNKNVIEQFHKQLEALPQAKEITKLAEDNYAIYGKDGKILNESEVKIEAITDYLAKVADGQIKIDRSNFEKVKDYVVNLLTKLGIMPEQDIRNINDLKKLAQTVSEKFAKGEEIKDVSEIKPNQKFEPIKNNGESGDVNAAGKIDPKNVSNAKVGNTNPLFSKEKFKEVELVNLPVKSLKEKLDEFDNKAIAINSDPTKVGKVEMPSGKEIFLYGGARYSSIKSNVEGEIGFSSTNLSKPKQVRGAIEKLFPEKNGEGLVLVTTQKPESMKGNAYSLEHTLDALSTLPKTILKSSEFKNEFFGKDIVAIKDAFGENKYNEFLKKYGRADFSNPEVFESMTDDLLSNVGANFIARNSLIDNMLAGIVAKDTRISTKGEPGYVSVDPKKYIAKQLLDRLGLNQEKLFYELGEKGIVDAYMNEGKWGFVTNGFTSDSKIDHLSIQDKGVIHPQFNSKFHGKDAFFLDGAYMIDKLFLPEEMITKKGDIYIKKASLMVAGSMYPKGKVELATKEIEKPFSEIPEQKTKTNDKENIPGVSGKVGVGEEPVTTEPIKGAGAEKTGAGGVLQAPGAEGEGKKGVQFSKKREEVKGTLDGKPVTFVKEPENVEVVNGFYSPIEKRLTETKIEKQSANKWKEVVGKGDEAKFTGVLGWLESLPPTQQVSKSEIQNWMKDNRVEINEVVKNDGYEFEEQILDDETYNNINNELSKRGIDDEGVVDAWYNAEENKDQKFYDVINFLSDNNIDSEYLIEKSKIDASAINQTKYKNYQLPGEKTNYKEVLVTLPSGNKELQNKIIELEKIYEKDGSNYNLRELESAKEELAKSGTTSFRSSHYDEPNILAHIRMNTRVDAEGNKVLHIEEFQSDWGQKGKKEGFNKKLDISIKESPNNRILTKDGKVLLNTFSDKEIKDWQIERAAKESGINIDELITDKSKSYYSEVDGRKTAGNFLTKEEATANANNEAERIGKSNIPEAPFVTKTQDWTKLAWKVALKEAVKEGADKITWTTGEQQNERYDLSKSVDEITYSKSKDGTYQFSGSKNDVQTFNYQKIPENKLEDYVGKEVAKKIINDEGELLSYGNKEEGTYNELGRTLSGVDLKVGGTGMKGFYGSPSEGKLGIVGEVAKSLFKQEPKTTELDTSLKLSSKAEQKMAEEGWTSGEPSKEGYTTQHSIDITPEMKAQVESGMPMFSKSKDKKMSDMKDILKEYVDEGKPLEEIKDILKDEFGDYYKDVEGIIDQAHQEMTTTSIKNAVTQRERGERGLAEVEVEAKRSFGKVFDTANEMIANNDINGLTLAAEVVKNPRPLKAEESAVLLIDRMRISKEYNKKNAELLEAQEKGETDKADIIQSQMEALEDQMDLNDEAAKKSGYEQGLGLAARRMLIAQDYSLVTQMNRLKAANGGAEVPKQYQEQLKDLITKLDEANKKLEQFEKNQIGTEKQKQLTKVKPVSRTPEQTAKEKQSIKSKIVSKWGQTLARMKAASASIKRSVSPTPITPEKQAQLESIVKDINDMVKLYAELGETNLKKIIDNIHQDLVGELPDLNRSDVEDVILGKYDKEKVKTPLTAEKIQALANVRKVKTQIDLLKEELKNKQRGALEKGMDYLHGWHRFSILSGVPSVGKIGTAALSRGGVTRAENILGQALSLVPGIRKIAKIAPREGGFSKSAEAKAFSTWFDKMTKEDMREVMKTGVSEIDYLYGKKEPMAGKVPEWMEFFGRMHSAIKLLPKRAEFFRSLEMRTEHALKNGKDINDPMVQQEMATAAYNDALRAIFMQENIATEAYTNLVKKLEKAHPSLASALKFALPIVKVPTNYVAEASSYVPPIAAIKALTTLYKGRKGMTEEQADYFMRAMKKGAIGTAFVFMGYLNPQAIGGYYTGKRKKDDLEAGDIELFGVKLPHFMLHTPLLEMLQIGATMRRAYDAKIGKGEEATHFTEGIPTVFKGLSQQVPFIGTGERISRAMESKGNAVNEYLYSLGKSILEPQLMQNIADWTDVEEGKVVKRITETFGESLKEGIPGLRKSLKKDKAKFTDKEYEEFSNITEKGLNIPELNKRTTYKVKIDDTHPDGHMTEEEFDKFIPLQKEYVKEHYKQFYKENKSEIDKLQKYIESAPETSKEKSEMNALKDKIQNKIDAIHNKAIRYAKHKIGLHQ